MPQYVEGPEAKGMESGFALDELLRRERADNARAVFGQVAQRAQQAQRQIFDTDQAAQQQRYALERMVKGEELKEQGAQREAERAAPALQAMIGGNPDTAKALGFQQPGQPQINRQGAMAEPEAAGIPAPITTPMQARTPTLQEATGMARAIPGMAQALLQHQLTLDKNTGFTLSPGQQRFDVTGKPIAGVPVPQGQTEAEADKIIADNIARDPSLRGRITKKQDDKDGSWSVQTAPSEPLTEGPNKWLADYMDSTKPMPARIIAGQKYQKWLQDQGTLLPGAKALAGDINKPFNEEAKKRMETTNMAIESAYRLQSYTKADREKFTGIGKLGWEAARLAQEGGLPTPGYDPAEVQRYSNFKKDNGMIEQFKFAIGGKQLTEGEQRVVEAFIPTGREFTTSEYEAKLKGIIAAMEAARELDSWLSITPKTEATDEAIRQRYREALKRRGIDVEASAKEATQAQMTSGQRLRNKYAKP